MTSRTAACIGAFVICFVAAFLLVTHRTGRDKSKYAALQIRDSRTSQPIPSATVILGGSSPATFGADEHGTVSINFKGPTIQLTVTAKGYQDTKYHLARRDRIALFLTPDEGPAEAISCWNLE